MFFNLYKFIYFALQGTVVRSPLILYRLADVQHVCECLRWATAGTPDDVLLLNWFGFLLFEQELWLLFLLSLRFCFTI